MDRIVVQAYNASKVKVFLYGAALAKENIYNSMDVIYRDPKGSLNALVAVINGRALDALNLKQGIGQKLHAFHFDAWSGLNWDKDYPNVKITPDIKVNIIQHGIIN
ncbi:hypothetical protein SAMN05443252_10649 [Bacillus sp. OV322]|nr:hypothetical protein SAMN05443252_10649 [Bacillus sp. OV322]